MKTKDLFWRYPRKISLLKDLGGIFFEADLGRETPQSVNCQRAERSCCYQTANVLVIMLADLGRQVNENSRSRSSLELKSWSLLTSLGRKVRRIFTLTTGLSEHRLSRSVPIASPAVLSGAVPFLF